MKSKTSCEHQSEEEMLSLAVGGTPVVGTPRTLGRCQGRKRANEKAAAATTDCKGVMVQGERQRYDSRPNIRGQLDPRSAQTSRQQGPRNLRREEPLKLM